MLYSATTRGFYKEEVHGINIPSDCVEISNEIYNSLIKSQSTGSVIVPDENGFPVIQNLENYSSAPPPDVTRAQGKAALIRAGLWQGVVDYVASISDPVEKAVAEVALNDTTNWQRSSLFLNAAAHALGLTDEQLDDLFLQASKIEL